MVAHYLFFRKLQPIWRRRGFKGTHLRIFCLFFGCFSQMRGVSSWTEHVLRLILVPKWSLAHGGVTALSFILKFHTFWGWAGYKRSGISNFWPFPIVFSHSPRVSSLTGHVLRAILVPNWSLAHGDVTSLIFFGRSFSLGIKGGGGSGESPPPGHFKNFSIFQENWPLYRFFGTNRIVSTPLWRIRGYFGFL